MVRFELGLRKSPRDPFNALASAGISTAGVSMSITWAQKAIQLRSRKHCGPTFPLP
jgi:hypothetical protein